jgi:hypothetical protein
VQGHGAALDLRCFLTAPQRGEEVALRDGARTRQRGSRYACSLDFRCQRRTDRVALRIARSEADPEPSSESICECAGGRCNSNSNAAEYLL